MIENTPTQYRSTIDMDEDAIEGMMYQVNINKKYMLYSKYRI